MTRRGRWIVGATAALLAALAGVGYALWPEAPAGQTGDARPDWLDRPLEAAPPPRDHDALAALVHDSLEPFGTTRAFEAYAVEVERLRAARAERLRGTNPGALLGHLAPGPWAARPRALGALAQTDTVLRTPAFLLLMRGRRLTSVDLETFEPTHHTTEFDVPLRTPRLTRFEDRVALAGATSRTELSIVSFALDEHGAPTERVEQTLEVPGHRIVVHDAGRVGDRLVIVASQTPTHEPGAAPARWIREQDAEALAGAQLYPPIQATEVTSLTLVVRCSLSEPTAACEARGLYGPEITRVFFGEAHTFLWAADASWSAHADASLVYRVPHDEGPVLAARAGIQHPERTHLHDGVLHAVATPRYAAEVQLVALPERAFRTAPGETIAPDTTLDEARDAFWRVFAFDQGWLYWGAGGSRDPSVLHSHELATGRQNEIAVPHGIDAICPVGEHLVVIGEKWVGLTERGAPQRLIARATLPSRDRAFSVRGSSARTLVLTRLVSEDDYDTPTHGVARTYYALPTLEPLGEVSVRSDGRVSDSVPIDAGLALLADTLIEAHRVAGSWVERRRVDLGPAPSH